MKIRTILLAGMLAAAMTKSRKLGVIGGTELPPVVESFRAFQKGARDVNPSIEIVTSYVGNWDDASAAKEQALAQMSHGVDVIFQCGGTGRLSSSARTETRLRHRIELKSKCGCSGNHARKRRHRSSARVFNDC